MLVPQLQCHTPGHQCCLPFLQEGQQQDHVLSEVTCSGTEPKRRAGQRQTAAAIVALRLMRTSWCLSSNQKQKVVTMGECSKSRKKGGDIRHILLHGSFRSQIQQKLNPTIFNLSSKDVSIIYRKFTHNKYYNTYTSESGNNHNSPK